MDTAAVELFSALLALATGAGAVAVLVVWVLSRSSETARGIVDSVRDAGLWLIAAVAGGAMLGSLYFSEVAEYVPCKLCWSQRICLFSTAIISLVAAIRRDRRVAPYTLTLASVGLVVSSYHYLVEWFPRLESDVCAIDVPCTTIWFREFGFVTLASMAGMAGLFVIVVSLLLVTGQRNESHE